MAVTLDSADSDFFFLFFFYPSDTDIVPKYISEAAA